MLIESKSFAKTVGIQVDFSPPVKGRIGVVDDAVVVGADDELVVGVIIEATDKIVDVVGLYDMGAVFFADFPAADLALIFVEELKIVADLAVHFPDPGDAGTLENRRRGVLYVVVEGGFHQHFRLVFYNVVNLVDCVPGDGLEQIGILIFRGVYRQVFPVPVRQFDHGPVVAVPLASFLHKKPVTVRENGPQRACQLPARCITDLERILLAIVPRRKINAIDFGFIANSVKKKVNVPGLASGQEPAHVAAENHLIFERDSDPVR